jgi:hypothetical protein
LCQQYVSHQPHLHYPPQHHFRKLLLQFRNLGSRQLLPQLSSPLSWPRRTHAHESGAATATHRLYGAPTADWVPGDKFRPRAQESAESQPTPYRLRNVESHRPRQAKVAASGPFYAHAKPSDAQPSDVQPSDAQLSDAQPASCRPQRPSPRLRDPCPCQRSPDLVRAFAQAQYAETRAANHAARYAARANRASARPQEHHLAQGIALGS